MAGIGSSFKAMGGGKGALKKMFLNTAAPLSKQNLAMNQKEWDTIMKPQAYEGPGTPGPRGATTAAMSEEELEEARRRRGAARRPASTVLTSGLDGETLGG